jgi:hypothetical protein
LIASINALKEIRMVTTEDAQKQRFYAGLFRRLGWGKKELMNRAEAEPEHRWAGLAEWLRVAHSVLDEKTVELTRNAD